MSGMVIKCEVSHSKRCLASSIFQINSCTVICYLYGPFETKPESNLVEIVYRDNEMNNDKTVYYQKLIEECLTLCIKNDNRSYKLVIVTGDCPKTGEAASSEILVAAFNASVLALVCAGVPSKMLYASSTFNIPEELLILNRDKQITYKHALGPVQSANTANADIIIQEMELAIESFFSKL